MRNIKKNNLKIFISWGKIFNIFEQACFRNEGENKNYIQVTRDVSSCFIILKISHSDPMLARGLTELKHTAIDKLYKALYKFRGMSGDEHS